MPILIAIGVGIISIFWQVCSQVVNVLIRPAINKLQILDGDVPIAPADAADMVERNIIDVGEGAGYAGSYGVRPAAFDLLVKNAGEPPGLEQMLSLVRRGLLDEGEMARMIAYSRVRTEWTPYVLDLMHDTMTQGDAIEGALKGVLGEGEAQSLFEMAGGLGDQFGTLLAIAGNPIGVESALNLWNHGFINEDQVTQVILHSRINPQFEQIAKLQRFKFLSAFQVVNAVKGGAATPQQAIQWLVADGYPVDQVTAVVQGAASGKTQTHKDATESQIAEMYEAGAIDKANAEARLVALGYEQSEADFVLSIYDEKRKLSMVQGAINQVRKVYLAGRIDDAAATNLLNELGVDPEAQGIYLTVWKVEAQSELKELTMAQIGSMFKKGLFTEAQAIARWEAMGYTADDAQLISANYGGTPPAGSPAAQTPASS